MQHIEHKFFTDFNSYYDQYANMLIKNHPSHNNQYVWSNKQHILMIKILFDTNNIEFIECINTDKNAQLDFIILLYDILNDDDIIKRISFTFHHDPNYVCQGNHLNNETGNGETHLANILYPPKSNCLKSHIINEIILDNDDDQQHDICNNNTKIGSYKCGNLNQHELWCIYCNTTYVNNERIMEINVKRWNISDYNLTWYTIQHFNNEITIFNNSPNLGFLQSYICLNRTGS